MTPKNLREEGKREQTHTHEGTFYTMQKVSNQIKIKKVKEIYLTQVFPKIGSYRRGIEEMHTRSKQDR